MTPNHVHEIFQSTVIIDDHPLFCDALSMTLESIVTIGELHTFPTLTEALNEIESTITPSLVFLDLNLPDIEGLDGLIRLKNTIAAPIVVVSSMFDNRLVNSVLKAGASGYIPKHSSREVFQEAFNALRQGKTYLPAGFIALDVQDEPDKVDDDVLARLATLTNQQARILSLLCDGKLNKQMAFELEIAEATVKSHVSAILRKLGVNSRTQVVLLAKQTRFNTIMHDENES